MYFIGNYNVLSKDIVLGRECDVMRWRDIVVRYPDRYIMLVNIKYDISPSLSPEEFTASVFGTYTEEDIESHDESEDWYKLADAGISFHCMKTTNLKGVYFI